MAFRAGQRLTAADLSAFAFGEWQVLSLINGWAAGDVTYPPSVRLIPGERVELVNALSGGTASNGTAVATLPEPFWPITEQIIPVGSNTGNALNLSIRTTGEIVISNVNTAPGAIFLCGYYSLAR